MLIDPVCEQVDRDVSLPGELGLELADVCVEVRETPGHLHEPAHEELFTLPDEYATYADEGR